MQQILLRNYVPTTSILYDIYIHIQPSNYKVVQFSHKAVQGCPITREDSENRYDILHHEIGHIKYLKSELEKQQYDILHHATDPVKELCSNHKYFI